LAAERVLRGEPVDQHDAAVVARAVERDAQLPVVGERAVAAVAVEAGQVAQQLVGGRCGRVAHRLRVEHRRRDGEPVQARRRPRGDAHRADDRRSPAQDDAGRSTAQRHVHRHEPRRIDRRIACGHSGAREGFAGAIGALQIDRAVARDEPNRRLGDGRALVVDHDHRGVERGDERAEDDRQT
jgi:hypothetical protein